MGSSHGLGKKEIHSTMKSISDKFEILDSNGFVLSDFYIPEEIVTLILSYVPPKELVFNCRIVCKNWCCVIDKQVWRMKCARAKFPHSVSLLPWFSQFWINTKNPLHKNLIRNGCGEEDLLGWNILSSGGDKWKIEKPPVGSGVPTEADLSIFTSCFATSFYSCSKEQVIDLKEHGAVPEFMDIVQPQITVTEWFCGRFDCRAVYELKVALLNEQKQQLDTFDVRENVGATDGWDWQKVSHRFSDFGPGVRYVCFRHTGQDCQFWAGHYGSKMTGASVELSLPSAASLNSE